MKKYILKILLFFAIVVTVDLCFGFWGDYLQTHAKGGETRRVHDFVMNDRHDIIIFGSSRAHHHYDTPYLSDTLDIDVYNAGFDGNGIVLAYGLFELVLERYCPRMVLFDIEPAFDILEYSNDNHYIRYINLLKPYYRHNSVGSLINDVSKEEWYKVHSGLIRYNSKLVSLVVDNVRTAEDETQGFEPSVGRYTGNVNDGDKTNRKEIIDEFKLKYLEEMIGIAKSHDIPILLVASPKLGVKDSKVYQPVIEICKRNDVVFLDYYANPLFQRNDFFKEPMHLNGDGARVFSREISNYIDIVLQ